MSSAPTFKLRPSICEYSNKSNFVRRFRWAELQIIELETCHNKQQIYKALSSIPQTLEDTYRKVLNSIQDRNLPLAREILMTICLAPVLLDLNTVAAIVGLDFPESVIEICTTSLVSEFDNKVQVAHFSVQEFLVVPQEDGQQHICQFSVIVGNEFLAERTVECLLEQTEPLVGADVTNLPAFLYAATQWHHHVTALGDIGQSNPSLQAKVDRLFTEPYVYHNWIRAAGHKSSRAASEWNKIFEECTPPIGTAARLGLTRTVETLCGPGLDSLVCLPRSVVADAVSAACNGGHLDVLQILLCKYPLETGSSDTSSILVSILGDTRCPKTEEANFKLAAILRTLWDLGVLQDKSPDLHDTIDVRFLQLVAMNPRSNAQIMGIFLEWEPEISVPITQNIMMLALTGPRMSNNLEKLYVARGLPVIPCILENIHLVDTELVRFLLQSHRDEFRVTQKVMEQAFMTETDGDMVQFLWPYREPGVEVSKSMFENIERGRFPLRQTMGFLLQQPESPSILDDELINDLFRRTSGGLELLELLSEYLEPGFFSLKGDVMKSVLETSKDGSAALQALLSTQPGFALSDELLYIICYHEDALNMLKFLVKDNVFTVTEGLICSASGNKHQGPSVIKYLEQFHQGPLPFTKDALISASLNRAKGGEVLSILLENTSCTSFPDEVFEAACQNNEALVILLDHQQEALPIAKMIGQIAASEECSANALQTLLERHIVKINETLVETLAVNFHALNVVFSWKADAPITEKALSMATRSPESMRMVMDPQRNPPPVTEEVLIAAAKQHIRVDHDGFVRSRSFVILQVFKAIKHRQGSISITERVLQAAVANNSTEALLSWLFQQQSEPFVAEFWKKTWPDANLTPEVRFSLLGAFLKRTNSNLTDVMLEDCPYDRDRRMRYWFDELMNMFYDDHSLPGIDVTDRLVEILMERCGEINIALFLKHHPTPITTTLEEAAARNPIADMKALMKLLERQKEGSVRIKSAARNSLSG